jgi:prepilin-type N-terminal cleavage/methylation domain-containing protein
MLRDRYTLRIHQQQAGFTLIELSIVLVIIGFIIGSVLVGRNLLKTTEVHSITTQVQKYNSAVNTFVTKYSYLPGDIPSPQAQSFGFIGRGSSPGWGDGNGLIEGSTSFGNYAFGMAVVSGETSVFWVDLSTARLIAQKLSAANFSGNFYPLSADPSLILPSANIGTNNYFYVASGGPLGTDKKMYFGLAAVNYLVPSNWHIAAQAGISVQQAYALDSKVDDGLPQSGKVQAFYYSTTMHLSQETWAAAPGSEGANSGGLATTTATTGSSSTCYDNSAVGGAQQRYSLSQNGGTNVNCALSFGFQ